MKPLVYVNTKVRIDAQTTDEVDSWELVAFGDCPIMHAAWNPKTQLLVCQINSVKENFVDFPVRTKSGAVNIQERRAEVYYRVTLSDKDAIQYILENFVGNYKGQDWKITVEDVQAVPEAV